MLSSYCSLVSLVSVEISKIEANCRPIAPVHRDSTRMTVIVIVIIVSMLVLLSILLIQFIVLIILISTKCVYSISKLGYVMGSMHIGSQLVRAIGLIAVFAVCSWH